MKLHSLYIKEYKILKDFRIDFNNPISVLIGMNGSGKSTVLEALAEIFNQCITNKKGDFEYEISYSILTLENETLPITIKEDKNIKGEKEIKITFDNSEGKAPKDYKVSFNEFIPSNVVIYYSGFSDLMQKIVEPYNQSLQENFRNGNQLAKSPFFYFTPAHFNIILATLFSYEYGDIPQFLEEKIGVDRIGGLKIKLKKPNWAKNKKMEDWWGADGEVSRFLSFLDTLGKPLMIDEEKFNNKGGINGNVVIEGFFNEFININIIGHEILYAIRDYFGEEKGLFNILNVMLLDELLESVEVYMEQKNSQKSFQNLSEGEQQLIVIKGLTELLKEENTLFLFDEPDVYLHPKWQGEFIKNISEGNVENAQYVITTHSPRLLSNFKDGEVHLMEKGEAHSFYPFYGRDIHYIMQKMGSDIRPEYITKMFSKLSYLVSSAKNLEDITKAEETLSILKEEISDNGALDADIIYYENQIDFLKSEMEDEL